MQDTLQLGIALDHDVGLPQAAPGGAVRLEGRIVAGGHRGPCRRGGGRARAGKADVLVYGDGHVG